MSLGPDIEDQLGPTNGTTSGDNPSASFSATALGVSGVDPTAQPSMETSMPDPDQNLYPLQPILDINPSVAMTQSVDGAGYAMHASVQAPAAEQDNVTSPGPFPSSEMAPSFDFDTSLNDDITTSDIYDQAHSLIIPSVPSLTNAPHQPSDTLFTDFQERNNLSFAGCLHLWVLGYASLERENPNPVNMPRLFPRLTPQDHLWGMGRRKRGIITGSDVEGGQCDVQGIDWEAFGVERSSARRMRRKTYFNHANVINSYPHHQMFCSWPMFASARDMNLGARAEVMKTTRIPPVTDTKEQFRFSRMSLQHQITIPHLQLRHIVSASSKNAIFFPTASNEDSSQPASGSKITNVNPELSNDSYTIDSAHTNPNLDTPKMQHIYALSAKNDVLVAGGLAGEYAYKSLSSVPSDHFTSGLMTISPFSSTNHVHTYLSRHSGLPRAVFSSNDSNIHTLDLTTNQFVSRHDHVRHVNCSATSPDTRLRVLVRDSIHSLVVEADSGRRIGKLSGHNDYGFACDWADDGIHFATGAQDGLVQIYDVRSWRQPIRTLLAELGGVRSLAFSPAGHGKQVLLAAESADVVHIVDASGGMFTKEHAVDFFGEIAGVTFDESGERFWVGVSDPDVGGLMEFERCKEGGGFGRMARRRDGREEDDDESEVGAGNGIRARRRNRVRRS